MSDNENQSSLLESYGKYVIPVILSLVGIGVFSLFALPTVQEILYHLLVANPATLQWSVIALVIGILGYYLNNQWVIGAAFAVFILMGLLIGPVVSGVYAHENMADKINSDNPSVDQLEETSNEHVRVLPREVADNYADSSIQKPQYRLTDSDISYQDGGYKWSYAVAPDNLMVSLQGNQDGAMYVNMEQTDKDANVVETKFKTGRGQIWFDGYDYKSVLSNPMVHHKWDTTFNSEGPNGEKYIAHSTVSHEWGFQFTPLPQLYAIPQLGTVEVMDTEGNVNSLTPEEAYNSELLEHENFYPYDVAMFKVESMQYEKGAFNKWFYKEGVLEVTDLPSSTSNDWPIVVPIQSEDGVELTYFIATEPTGSGSGVYEIWTLDGQTGEANVKSYNESQIGPNRAIDFVERQPDVNRLSNAQPVSPIPVVIEDNLFWHVKVIPQSESGIIYTGFVNAQSGDVTLLEGTEPIYAFMSQDEVDEIRDSTNQTSGDTTTVKVAVTDSNGDIVKTTNVSVPEGGEADINIQNPE